MGDPEGARAARARPGDDRVPLVRARQRRRREPRARRRGAARRAIREAFEVAVMGCAVNGPGEAGDADFGIAGGRDVGFIYAHGRVLKKVPSEILIDELFVEIDRWIAGRDAASEAAQDGEAGGARDGRGQPDPARLTSRLARQRTAPAAGRLDYPVTPHAETPVRAVPADAAGRPGRRRGRLAQAARPRRADSPGRRRALELPPGRLAGAPRRSCRSSARRWTRSAARRCSMPVLTPAELWQHPAATRSRSSSS